MAELDKFKRRLIRSVARLLLAEQKTPEEVWETLKKETGRDCDEIWKRMRALTLKKLNRLLANDDYIARIGKIARMTHTDWLMFDLVLVYEEIDVITVEGRKAAQPSCLQDLLALAREFKVDSCPVGILAAQWRDLTLQYNLNGRQISPMLLQLRWHQMQQSTRDVFYKFWFSFRGIMANIKRNKPQRPSRLQLNIANSFYDIITQPFHSWKEMVELRRVVPQEEFARLHRRESLANRPRASENEPDLVVIEPNIDTVTLDSDEENSFEDVADNVEEKLKDDNDLNSPQSHDPQHNPETTLDKANNITNIQEHLGITIKDEPVDCLDDLIDVIDQRTEKEEDGLSNVKILAATHVPTQDIDPPSDKLLTKEIDADPSMNASPKNIIITGDVACDRNQEIDLSMKDDLIKIVENDITQKIDHGKGILNPMLNTEDRMDAKKKYDNDLDDDNDDDIFFYTNLDDDKPENKQLAEVEDEDTKMGESSVIGELPTSFEVIDDGIEFDDEYDDDNYCKDEVVDGVKQQTETSQNTIGESEDDLKTEEDQSLEDTMPKFDLKLIMQPVVYTTRLDDMILFNKENENYESVKTELTIAQILVESKPVSSKSIHPKPAILHVGESDVVPLIKEDQLPSDDLIKLEPSIASEDEHNSSDDEDIETVDSSSTLFQKPKLLNYNPIQLCKNPDFNTKLKRLPVGFFVLESNRQYLKIIKPVTIDLDKSFEAKLMNNTVYLKPNPLSDIVTSQERNTNNVSVVVVPSAVLAQSLVDATAPSKPTEDAVSNCYSTNAGISDEDALLAERKNKVISLPDITKIRRINQHLQTAEVSPILQSKEDIKPEIVLKANVTDAQDNIRDVNKYVHVIEYRETTSKVDLPKFYEVNDSSVQQNLGNENEAIALASIEKEQAVEVEIKPHPELTAAIEQLTQPNVVADINLSAAQAIYEPLLNQYLTLNNTTIPERTIDTVERTREVRSKAQITNKAKKKTQRTQPIPWYSREIRPQTWQREAQQTDTFGTITNDTLFKMLKFLGGNEEIFMAPYDKQATEKLRKELSSETEKKPKDRPKHKGRGRPVRKTYCCWARKRISTGREYMHDCFINGDHLPCTCCCKEFNEDVDKYSYVILDKDDDEFAKGNHSDEGEQYDRTDQPDKGDIPENNDKPNKDNGPDSVSVEDNSEIMSAVQKIRQTLKLKPEPKIPKPAVRVVAASNVFRNAGDFTHKFTSRPIGNLQSVSTQDAVPTIDITTESATDQSADNTNTDNFDAIRDIPAAEVEIEIDSNLVGPTNIDGSTNLTNIASVDLSTQTAIVDSTIHGASIDLTNYIPVNNTTDSTNITSEGAPEASIVSEEVTSLNTSNASELIVLSDDENNPASPRPQPSQLILPQTLSQIYSEEQMRTNTSIADTEKKGPRKVWKTKYVIKCSPKMFRHCPVDVGEGCVLLTTAKIPPELLNPAFKPAPKLAPKPAPAVALTDLTALPPGVEITVAENGNLVCNLQPGLLLDADQLNDIYSAIASVQQQLQSSVLSIGLPPLVPCENTVVLSDDEVTHRDRAVFDETNSSIRNSDSTNVIDSSVTPTTDHEIDLHTKEKENTDQSKISEINPTTNLDKHIDGEKETIKVAEDCDVGIQDEAADAAPIKETEVNTDASKSINQSGDSSEATHQITELDESENSRKKESENTPAIGNNSEDKLIDLTTADVETETGPTVIDKSENITEANGAVKENVEGNGDVNNILSDLMAMSGISSEDFQAPVEPIAEHIDNDTEILSPVTSMDVLRYAYDQKAKFLKYNIATKKSTLIRMSIQKMFVGKNTESHKPQSVIDLTDTSVEDPGAGLATLPITSVSAATTRRTYKRRTLGYKITNYEPAPQIRKRKQTFDDIPKELAESDYPRLEIDGTFYGITGENYCAKSNPPVIIRNVKNSKLLLRPDLPVEPERKRRRSEKIEAKIYLDSDNPMEEEYLVDSSSDEGVDDSRVCACASNKGYLCMKPACLEQRFSVLLAQAQAQRQESSSDNDVDSDDEPLAKKVTRRKRQEEKKTEKMVTVCIPTEYLDLHQPSDDSGEDDFILGA